MSFIAEFELDSPLLQAASESLPDVEITDEDFIFRRNGLPRFIFKATGDGVENLGSALEDDPTVEQFTCLGESAVGRIYRVTYADVVEEVATYQAASEYDVVFLDFRLRAGMWHIRVRAPSRDALHRYRELCRERDLGFELERIYQQTSDGSRYGLTDCQHETLLLAFEMGYFDSPRTATLSDVADELGVTRQAVADRLRRGHRQLVESTLA